MTCLVLQQVLVLDDDELVRLHLVLLVNCSLHYQGLQSWLVFDGIQNGVGLVLH